MRSDFSVEHELMRQTREAPSSQAASADYKLLKVREDRDFDQSTMVHASSTRLQSPRAVFVPVSSCQSPLPTGIFGF